MHRKFVPCPQEMLKKNPLYMRNIRYLYLLARSFEVPSTCLALACGCSLSLLLPVESGSEAVFWLYQRDEKKSNPDLYFGGHGSFPSSVTCDTWRVPVLLLRLLIVAAGSPLGSNFENFACGILFRCIKL
ncbi:ADP,ATP carrier protein 2 [Frankliniella fusca]|uniref:ADP,ATP carrier protein 2 n=1 Tax=Frankliniella fusca TaxID=407009 RepID=A0AAE1HGU6_9NEOP|nr:ADP,ATP carrier protein 2 [Frankliniella fusca]